MAGKFDDAQLRVQALKLKDPYDQPDLITHIPQDAQLLDIVNVYVFERYPIEKAFCVFCQGHHHKRGFTAILASGHRVMCGSKCGADHFGTSWSDAEKRIDERADRQFELKKIDRLAACGRSFDVAAHWERSIEHLWFRRQAFDAKCGELASRAKEAALHKRGQLTVFKKVRNKAAEAAGMQSLGGAEVVVGSLAGSKYVLASDFLTPVKDMVQALAGMQHGISDSEGIATKALAKRRREFERSLEGIEAAAEVYEAAHEFWTRENFEGLLRWSNEHGATNAKYSLSETGIVSQVGRSDGLKIDMKIPDIDLSLLDAIKEYRRAD